MQPKPPPIVMTALHTWFRTSKLLSLTQADVDFRLRVITVHAGYVKNGESRSVPMNEVLLSTLKPSRMIALSADTPVFCTPQETP